MATRYPLRSLDMADIALFSVLMAVCAWTSVPMPPVPFTLQTFAVFLTLTTLGGRRGTYAVIVYLLLGAVGLPVFAGFQGGLATLLGATGGYILGFLFSALVYRLSEHNLPPLLSCLLGLAVCYIFGTVWYLAVYARTFTPAAIVSALGLCIAPFVLPDLVKLALALTLSRKLKPRLR